MNIEFLINYVKSNIDKIKNNQALRIYNINALEDALKKCKDEKSNSYQEAKRLLFELKEKEKGREEEIKNKIKKIQNWIEQGKYIFAYNLIYELPVNQQSLYCDYLVTEISKKVRFDKEFGIINFNEIEMYTPKELLQDVIVKSRKSYLSKYIDRGDYIQAYELLKNCVGFREERRELKQLILNDLIDKLEFDYHSKTNNLREIKQFAPLNFHSILEEKMLQQELVYIENYIKDGLYSRVFELVSFVDDKEKDKIINKIKKNIFRKIIFQENGDSNFNEITQDLPSDLMDLFCADFLKLYMDQIKFVGSNYINFIKNSPLFLRKDILINGFVIPLLKDFNFLNADNLQKTFNDLLKKNKYEKTKAIYVQKYFKSIGIDINEEQAFALSKIAQNNLISARAGSGKTRTIACRAILAMEKENIKPEEIMLFSFNKKAKEEIAKRIYDEEDGFGYKKFICDSAKTFHGLAYNICRPKEEIIYDDPSDDIRQKLSMYISKLYHSEKIWTKEFKELYYSYFKLESEKDLHYYWTFSSDEQRYNYLRNKRYITLNREKVKSDGEKWIADFLFEHGINYKYEKVFTSGKDKLYKPDFVILNENKNIVLEHWGIDLEDRTKTVPKHWTKTWHEYYEEIRWKRTLCERKNTPLIETSIIDMRNGRKDFEENLKAKLKAVGINCSKIPQETLLAIIDAKHKDDVAKKFATFIQTAHKAKMSPKVIERESQRLRLSERARCFIKLALIVYREYDIELKKRNLIDFDNILINAFKIIQEQGKTCKVRVGDLGQTIDNLKLILIDEYQDFSQMFYDLINEIIVNNPNIRVFCVGDDWQAINGFAGSELKFFRNYDEYYKHTDNTSLTFNYRSGQDVVDLGNNIMIKEGTPAKCFRNDIKVDLVKCYVDDVPIKQKGATEFDTQFMYDGKSFFDINHRYFKLCYEIIKQNPDKEVFILSRTNYLAKDNDLFQFGSALISKLAKDRIRRKDDKNISINTIHKFKGKEADIVILLECDNENFPLIHPDNEIYCVFGKHMQDFLDEEKRLFYVAVTRAKEKIYFLCEKSIENDFIQNYPYIKTKRLCFN